ncbi:MAG: radical SAM protein [Hyphomicrobiaceae bacterium]
MLQFTAKGEPRASAPLRSLETLWFNTGTLCNITCGNCYIESSPRNDRLAYLSLDDVTSYLDEIVRDSLPTRLIGFTGGEPFMNGSFPAILEETLSRGFETLTLTNAMRPMMRRAAVIAKLAKQYGHAMRLRVSLDDFRAEVHDRERGAGSFARALEGLKWLSDAGVVVEVAGRFLSGGSEDEIRAGFAKVLSERGIGIDCANPEQLVLLPEMSPMSDPPEITPACWSILGVSPDGIMCASARMVVRRKGAARAAVMACTLLPYDERFELGRTLAEASKPVYLAHKYCATFCVLGGASCGRARQKEEDWATAYRV